MDPRWDYQEAMLLQQEYVCWRTEVRLDPTPAQYLMLARWEELARQHCGSMLNAQIDCLDDATVKAE
jgi:hypothetical protein